MLEDIIRVEINHCARFPAPRSVTTSRLIDEEALQMQIWVRSQHLSDPKLSKYWWKLNRRYCSRGSGKQITFLPWRNRHRGVCQEKLNSFVLRVRLLYGGWGMIFYCGKHVSRSANEKPPLTSTAATLGAALSSRGKQALSRRAAERGAGPGATGHAASGADAQRAGRGAPLAVVLQGRGDEERMRKRRRNLLSLNDKRAI